MVVVGVEGVRSVERGAVRQLGGVGSEMRMGISGKGERRGRGDMALARHSIEVPRRVPAQEFVCAGVVGGAVGLLSAARHIWLSIEASRGVLLQLSTPVHIQMAGPREEKTRLSRVAQPPQRLAASGIPAVSPPAQGSTKLPEG